MLLGYPGPAIASFADAEADEQRWKQMESVTIAPGLYDSPDVTFAVSKAVRNHDDVLTTVNLWRATLDAVYEMYRPGEQ